MCARIIRDRRTGESYPTQSTVIKSEGYPRKLEAWASDTRAERAVEKHVYITAKRTRHRDRGFGRRGDHNHLL